MATSSSPASMGSRKSTIRSPRVLRSQSAALICFLKLSFTELHGDHRENWAYPNLDPARQQRCFPDNHATRVEAIKNYAGLGYVVGEVFYSNSPALMTRPGEPPANLRGSPGPGSASAGLGVSSLRPLSRGTQDPLVQLLGHPDPCSGD